MHMDLLMMQEKSLEPLSAFLPLLHTPKKTRFHALEWLIHSCKNISGNNNNHSHNEIQKDSLSCTHHSKQNSHFHYFWERMRSLELQRWPNICQVYSMTTQNELNELIVNR